MKTTRASAVAVSEPITVDVIPGRKNKFPLASSTDTTYTGTYHVEIRDADGWYLGKVYGQKESIAKENGQKFAARCNKARRLLESPDFYKFND